VFFFPDKILSFFDKEIEKILEFFFPSVNLTNFSQFLFKNHQNSDIENNLK
jgi:hypothetical protein